MNNFIRDYILSLKEDGELDWLIANIGIAKNWSIIRLPFLRQMDDTNKLKKGEREFGIDMSFLAGEHSEELVIFALKDEKLTSGTWGKNGFQKDLFDAAVVPLDQMPYKGVSRIRLILAYNKDENSAGQKSYERFAKGFPSNRSLGDDNPIPIHHERWNIDRICQEVEEHLFSPDLLPRELAAGLHYLCSQLNDFHFGTTEWEKITIPTWKQYLGSIINGESRKLARQIHLVSVCCAILAQKLETKSKGVSPALIDLMEIALLASLDKTKSDIQGLARVYETIQESYITLLNNYVFENAEVFEVKDGFDQHSFFGLSWVKSANTAFWNVGRIALLLHFRFDQLQMVDDEKLATRILQDIRTVYALLVEAIRNNSGIYRPLVDLHHIELFLVWSAISFFGSEEEIEYWLKRLGTFLAVRRKSKKVVSIPFVESYNRMDLVAEYAASGNRPLSFTDRTSFLVEMLLELSFILPDEKRNGFLDFIVGNVISGRPATDIDGESEALQLVTWQSLEDWAELILGESQARKGTTVTVNFFGAAMDEWGKVLIGKIDGLIANAKHVKTGNVLPTALFLASIRNKSPLPPDFWRMRIRASKEKTKFANDESEEE